MVLTKLDYGLLLWSVEKRQLQSRRGNRIFSKKYLVKRNGKKKKENDIEVTRFSLPFLHQLQLRYFIGNLKKCSQRMCTLSLTMYLHIPLNETKKSSSKSISALFCPGPHGTIIQFSFARLWE